MRQHLTIRFDYGKTLPWVRQVGEPEAPALLAAAGPNAVVVRGPKLVPMDDVHAHASEFRVAEGDVVDLCLTWFHSHREAPPPLDVEAALSRTRDWWIEWAHGCIHHGSRYEAEVTRSLIFLRAHPLRDRRRRGGRDHVAARGVRRLPQLGLPLRLAAGRVADPVRAGLARLSHGQRALAQLAPAGRGR
jgi:hypothetical protein